MFQLEDSDLDVRLLRWVCLAAAAILAPFAVLHALRGDLLLFAAVGGLTLIMAVVAWQLWRTDNPINPLSLLVGMGLANFAVAVAGAQLHSEGMYWGFAAAGANSFVLGPWYGLIYTIVLGVSMLVAATFWAETSELIRFGASFTLLSIFIYIFSHRVQQKQRTLRRLTLTDPLTSLGNRRSLEIAMTRELARAKRFGYTASLIAIDLDHFKQINDTHGHAVGDQFLADFAHMLKHRVRQTDEVFRIGGEEFLVLTPTTSAMGAFELAEELRGETPAIEMAGLSDRTLSAGISELQVGDTADSWLNRADDALYRAKKSGRNRVILSLASDSETEGAAKDHMRNRAQSQ